MLRSRIARMTLAGAGAAVVLGLGGLLAWWAVDVSERLQETQAELRETEAALAESAQRLAGQAAAAEALARDGERLAAELADERAVARQLDIEGRTLRADREALVVYLTDAQNENAVLSDVLEESEDTVKTLRSRLDRAEGQVATLSGENAGLAERLGATTGQLETRNSEYTSLLAEHEELVQAAGTVDELSERIVELQGEVDALEERRRPLILSMERENVTGFLCTGSMEPAITCLDTATWTRPLRPEEVTVGTVITFANSACWGDDAGRGTTAHRVADVRVDGGIRYYWPKGDALPNADGCWVPHGAVRGYIIAVHRNTEPANALLRDSVNAAKAAYDEVWLEYLDVIEANCGHREPHRCSVDGSSALGQQAQAVLARVMEASDLYSCWYANAAASQRPGDIPYEC